ncbi:MAG: chorismate synthase [Oscillospiraceae bacterium]|jgi:chorismate synthase|nr:chorismate synthase [Oscillospiraceae bacterium]
MNSEWGTKFRLSVFGESHGAVIGVVVGGLPAGFAPDFDEVRRELLRRAPGRSENSTPRREGDEFEVLSGMLGGAATGAPLLAFCRNADARPGDYESHFPRPGHADYAAWVKYGAFNDCRGGGHFSGRLTAPVVFAGALAKQLLRERHGAGISAIVAEIHGERDPGKFDGAIQSARDAGDSAGGIIECRVRGAPAGWGEPIFHSVESELASLLFSIPAVKGVEFGDGFNFAKKLGGEVSDGLTVDEDGKIAFLANHNGGINGGITNGAEIVFRVVIKPTPTISAPQSTVDLRTNTPVTHSFRGRHDPCIVPRAVVVVEAAAAIALAQYL